MSVEYDCQRCGACCCNPSENVAEGYTAYVSVEKGDEIVRRKDLMKKFVTADEDGRLHLRLAPDGRCLALKGALGKSVKCDIYHYRPSPCRRVQAGDKLCLRYRADRGLPV